MKLKALSSKNNFQLLLLLHFMILDKERIKYFARINLLCPYFTGQLSHVANFPSTIIAVQWWWGLRDRWTLKLTECILLTEENVKCASHFENKFWRCDLTQRCFHHPPILHHYPILLYLYIISGSYSKKHKIFFAGYCQV